MQRRIASTRTSLYGQYMYKECRRWIEKTYLFARALRHVFDSDFFTVASSETRLASPGDIVAI